ncbi:HAD-IIIA family hydrolase [Pseudonocardia sp. KRD291]|uniref:HAD-IIIA family hydrolase n=1 Tax=Pseudonocardia sp. KRD291 TaxID=2792007 RepID=UPI001C4A4685|nr:HAD-IIIA family hydrolase [Pseudonocardia sp. KRD291]MBW0101316.1 HAD-IIIA family hydrolase [Pseudonocardia sp. KRD291]
MSRADGPPAHGADGHPAYTVVVPTAGRARLADLLADLRAADGPGPDEIVLVDDRPDPGTDPLPGHHDERVLHSGGHGPAAARNTGWRAARTPWVAFLDDDVRVPADWPHLLAADLRDLAPDVAASQARIAVPLPPHRSPTDDERGTAALSGARWITADMAYRRDALLAVGGFDERFPRAYREDSDLGLRVRAAGYRIVDGDRVTTHPPRAADRWTSVRAQAGNADDALMRRKHGRGWRDGAGAGTGRLSRHALTVAAGLAGAGLLATGHRRAGWAAALGWAGLTTEFAARRIAPGPRTGTELVSMAVTSVAIPPVACAQRLRGELRVRRGPSPDRALPAAVLFDRDDTLIVDVPYLADPDGVRPVDGAAELMDRLRAAGIPVGVVSNQSGVARGLIAPDRLTAVNARVEELLGPFGTWQVCPHGEDDGCACRKPAPGLVHRAAAALGVDVRRCVVLGDTGADVRAALAAGARAVLVPTARTLPDEVVHARAHAAVARDLRHGVEVALAGAR